MKNFKEITDALEACIINCEICFTDSIIQKNNECIAICRDCADICSLTLNFVARGSKFRNELYAICVRVCHACADECSKHASHHHCCAECMKTCKHCAYLCNELLAA